ncbi:unnamed protein product [Leptidea sinapis]|uniref:Uncharacterized protein n=1 Tax=Leptidea sinapis TaxID=189913 RepID=A0A5E4QKB1_9NEOP|nr:unnamed protein product [Leptidea sinapis]
MNDLTVITNEVEQIAVSNCYTCTLEASLRFAKMQVMAGLLTVLRKCRVELADGMPRTLEFEPRALTTQPIQEIYVKLIRR